MPKLAIAVLLLALVALAGSMTYVGYLVIGIVSEYLGTGRFMAGFLLVVLFARVPWVSQGNLRTVGLLPRNARLPVMVVLLAFCALNFLYRGQMVSLLFVTLAVTFLLSYRWLRKKLLNRMIAFLSRSSPDPSQPQHSDETVIDGEFREKKD
ncbi:MAG: hypothetical protein HYS18_11995 [Burkholderiales bacterium]|nr:hypothetical protein [Burkholderiales bacterium]